MRTNQKGYTIVEVVVVVLVIGLLAFIGLRVWGSYSSNELASNAPSTTDNVSPVKTAGDLAAVEKQLEDTDVDGSFEQDLNSELSF